MKIKLSIILASFLLISAALSCTTQKIPKEEKITVPPTGPSITSGTQKENTNTQPELRFAVMADSRGSDNGINASVIKKTLNEIKKATPQPSFAVMPGDLVGGSGSYEKIKAQLQYFKDTITKYYPIDFFYPGFGNHEASAGLEGEKAFGEVFSEFKANFLEGMNKTVYFFDSSECRFYMLNSNHSGESHTISSRQLDWVKTNTDPGKLHNFYFFHEPAYPTGPHIGSSLDADKMMRDKLWEAIDRSNGPMVFCGHEHFYTRRHINSDFNETVNGQSFNFIKSVYQVTTGTFGAPFYHEYLDKRNVDVPPVAEYHYAIVDIIKDKIQVTVYNLDGKAIDSFEQ
ncbi:MAG: metallophosphoesterase [Bacillota bacterium]|nr:metallophosphoesterase [Bacillota bacterium]